MLKKKIWVVLGVIFLVLIGCKSADEKAAEEVSKLLRNDRVAEAIDYATKSIDKFPNSAPLFYQRGFCYHLQNQNDKALNDFTNCIRIDSKFANGHYGIALIYEDKGQYDLAENSYNKAIEFAKNNERKSVYLSGMAGLYNSKKEYSKSIEYINQSINLSNDSDSYYSLGLYLKNNGQKKEAEEAWLLGLKKNNFKGIRFKHYIYYFLAGYYFDEKDYEKAKDNIEKALELSPNNNDYVLLFNKIKKAMGN